jgi:hypothetical protein
MTSSGWENTHGEEEGPFLERRRSGWWRRWAGS